MPALSIRDAARQVGVSRSSILRAIQSGRMSAPRKDDGGYAIDPAELFRVFEPKPRQGDTLGAVPAGQTGQGAEPDETEDRAALEAQIQALKELVRRLDQDKQEMSRRFDQDKEDLKADRDAWKQQAERLALAPPTPVTVTLSEPRGWWPFRRRA